MRGKQGIKGKNGLFRKKNKGFNIQQNSRNEGDNQIIRQNNK